jgi:hypothetical protein
MRDLVMPREGGDTRRLLMPRRDATASLLPDLEAGPHHSESSMLRDGPRSVGRRENLPWRAVVRVSSNDRQ